MQSKILKPLTLAFLALVGITTLIPIGRAQKLGAGAALQDKGANEKLLTALRDADLRAASALLSLLSGGSGCQRQRR